MAGATKKFAKNISPRKRKCLEKMTQEAFVRKAHTVVRAHKNVVHKKEVADQNIPRKEKVDTHVMQKPAVIHAMQRTVGQIDLVDKNLHTQQVQKPMTTEVVDHHLETAVMAVTIGALQIKASAKEDLHQNGLVAEVDDLLVHKTDLVADGVEIVAGVVVEE